MLLPVRWQSPELVIAHAADVSYGNALRKSEPDSQNFRPETRRARREKRFMELRFNVTCLGHAVINLCNRSDMGHKGDLDLALTNDPRLGGLLAAPHRFYL
jgi:hypothetical protein